MYVFAQSVFKLESISTVFSSRGLNQRGDPWRSPFVVSLSLLWEYSINGIGTSHLLKVRGRRFFFEVTLQERSGAGGGGGGGCCFQVLSCPKRIDLK